MPTSCTGKRERVDSKKKNKEDVAFDIFIKAGSTGAEIHEQAFRHLIDQLVGKLNGKEAAIVICFFILVFFGADVAREWVNSSYEAKRREAEASERVALSAEETRRMEIFRRALQLQPQLSGLQDAANDSKESLVKSVIDESSARVLGVELTGEEAKVIVSPERLKGQGRKLDGVFDIIDVGNENPEGYDVIVRHVESKEEFKALAGKDMLTREDLDVIFDQGLRDNLQVHLQVNAWYVNEKIERAAIVRASQNGGGETHASK